MDFIFELKDKTNRRIYLPRKTWSHIMRKHPYLSGYVEEIKETVQKPDKVIHSLADRNVRYYYKYYKQKNKPHEYLLVVVKYLNNSGFIITAYFVSSIK